MFTDNSQSQTDKIMAVSALSYGSELLGMLAARTKY